MRRALLLALALTACDDGGPGAADALLDAGVDLGPPAAVVGVDPPSGSMAGYYPVTLDLAPLGLDPAAVDAVRIAGVAAYALRPDGDRLTVTVQGAPEPGPAEVELDIAGATHALGPRFTYDPPLDPRFARIAAIGASLGQGVQRGVPSPHGALMSPPALIARHLGGHMPLPVPVDGFLTPIELSDVGPPPECETPDVADFIVAQAGARLPELVDPETGAISIALARAEPEVLPYNLSTGNCKVADVLRGPTTDLAARILSHFVYEPEGSPFGPVRHSQLDMLEVIRPTLVVSVDLYGNDLINGLVDADEIDPDANSPLDALHADLEATLDRLAALDAEVFIGDLPRPGVLARGALRRARAGSDAERAEVDARLARIDADVEATNAALWRLAARHPNIHVVPLAARVDALADGFTVAGQPLDIRRFGGLVGLDGLHFTDSGYALVADTVLATIEETLAVPLPPFDLAAVVEADPETPARLRAAGLEPDDCLR